MENLRKRINVKDVFTKHAAKANFISGKISNENLFAINRIKEQFVLNRSIYVGMTILELSNCMVSITITC